MGSIQQDKTGYSQICPTCITWASKYAKLKYDYNQLTDKYRTLEYKYRYRREDDEI
jgi:glutaredoxin-related protein